jgi:CRISPR-associated autoregulator DevR family
MVFVTGLFLIDASASALNNLGAIEGERFDNSTGVKVIRNSDGAFYPYVSAQAFRYWLRQTLEKGNFGWKKAPIYREAKVAYTDANPIKWWDDDLFGYMRAPSKKESAKAKREEDTSREGETETKETITRTSVPRQHPCIDCSSSPDERFWSHVKARRRSSPPRAPVLQSDPQGTFFPQYERLRDFLVQTENGIPKPG